MAVAGGLFVAIFAGIGMRFSDWFKVFALLFTGAVGVMYGYHLHSLSAFNLVGLAMVLFRAAVMLWWNRLKQRAVLASWLWSVAGVLLFGVFFASMWSRGKGNLSTVLAGVSLVFVIYAGLNRLRAVYRNRRREI